MIKRWFFDQMKMGEKSEIFNKIFKIGLFGLLYGPENLKAWPNTIHWPWKGYEVLWFLGWRIILLIPHISVKLFKMYTYSHANSRLL